MQTGTERRCVSEIEFGNGYSVQNLRYMRQFYQSFRKRHAVRGESQASDKEKASSSKPLEKRHPVGGELPGGMLRPELSWTHYRLLLRVENEKAPEWYMNETPDQSWSPRQLDRQIRAQVTAIEIVGVEDTHG